MLIALPTCADLPAWEVDDTHLHRALDNRGCQVARPVWDDNSVDWGMFHACLVRTTWDWPEKRRAFVTWAEYVSGRTPLFNPAPVIRWATNKRYLRQLAKLGLPTIPTVWLQAGHPADVAAIVAEHGWQVALLKPAFGSSSRATLRFEATAHAMSAAQSHLDRMLPTESMLLQPYLESVETSGELSIVFIDGCFSHAVRRRPASGDYRVQEDFGGSDEPSYVGNHEVTLARRCIAIAAPNGHPLLYSRVDFLQDNDGCLRLNELELADPTLFFRHAPQAAETLAAALTRRIADS